MIRRDEISASGPTWTLIAQREHARLAGELAAAWDLTALDEALRATLVWAAHHHDDGWDDWDQHPQLDPQGRPIAFREMSVDDSNRIWADSIGTARRHSLLAGYLVACHFLDLRATGTGGALPASCQFTGQYGPLAAEWLDQWRASAEGRSVGAANAVRAVACLQLFDWLSLLLCCGPIGANVVLPRDVAGRACELSATDPWHLSLEPWPLQVPALRLSTTARQVEARRYRDVHELQQAALCRELVWELNGGG
jgi:hypothetical protein